MNGDSRSRSEGGFGGRAGKGGRGRGKPKGRSRRAKAKRSDDRNRCRFCRANLPAIDYKDVITLQKLVTSQGKMFSRKRSGNCARHQRASKLAIKKSRYMGLMAYIGG